MSSVIKQLFVTLTSARTSHRLSDYYQQKLSSAHIAVESEAIIYTLSYLNGEQ